MSWAEIKQEWAQVGGTFREKFGQLTRQDISDLAGDRSRLVNTLRETYGFDQEMAERQVENWKESLDDYREIPTSTSGASTY